MMVVHQEGLPKASQAFAEGEFEERMGGMSRRDGAVQGCGVNQEGHPGGSAIASPLGKSKEDEEG